MPPSDDKIRVADLERQVAELHERLEDERREWRDKMYAERQDHQRQIESFRRDAERLRELLMDSWWMEAAQILARLPTIGDIPF